MQDQAKLNVPWKWLTEALGTLYIWESQHWIKKKSAIDIRCWGGHWEFWRTTTNLVFTAIEVAGTAQSDITFYHTNSWSRKMPTAVLSSGTVGCKIPFLRDLVFAWTYDLWYTSNREILLCLLCNLADIPGGNSKIDLKTVPGLSTWAFLNTVLWNFQNIIYAYNLILI